MLQAMTIEQLKEEKLSVQKALLQYENSHGRPVSFFFDSQSFR